MTPSKWLASFTGLLLVAGAVFLYRSSPSPVAAPLVAPATTAHVPSPAPAPALPAAPPMKRVMDLYEAESQRVGKVDPDPALTEKRLTAAAKELSPEEFRWLGEQALDTRNEMDARFFATYLTALGRSEAGVATLCKISLSKVPKSKNEMRMQEERALRMQAVEGLSRNCAILAAKDCLLDTVGVEDEALRDRAHRALYACQTGKRIEDADKAALEQLRKKRPK